MDNLLFQDKNQSYSVKFDTKAYEQMLYYCAISNPYETGGILIGNYSSNQAIANILQITSPPKNFRLGMGPRSVLFRRVALSSKCIVGTK